MVRSGCQLACVVLVSLLGRSLCLVDIKVSTSAGVVTGFIDENIEPTTVYRFINIPFAEPPVGNLRWQRPLPKTNWTGIQGVQGAEYDSKMVTACMQDTTTPKRSNYSVSEDCLYLNVYTPNVTGKPRAVMFWIHGGGFAHGAAHEYDGSFLATKDLVVVTVNYRLNVFGNFYDQESGKWRNLAMWDLRLALEWVQDNIGAFGGDKTRVTIFGGSAGAMATSFMSFTPHFDNLFHRVIAESGSALCPKLWARNPKSAFDKVLNFTDCSNWSCLLQMDEKKLYDVYKTVMGDTGLTFPVAYWFAPYVDDEMVHSDLVDIPSLYQNKEKDASVRQRLSKFQSYDFMVGYNTVEGSLILSYLSRLARKSGYDLNEGVDSNVVRLFLDEYLGQYYPKNYEEMKHDIINRYFRANLSDKPSREQASSVLSIYTDLLFASPALILADIHSSHSENRENYGFTYLYSFTHETHDSKLINPTWMRGSRHTDERTYVFGTYPIFYININQTLTEEEVKLKDQMMTAWSNFAKTGNPDEGDLGMKWRPYSTSRQYVMVFGQAQYDVMSRMSDTRWMADVNKLQYPDMFQASTAISNGCSQETSIPHHALVSFIVMISSFL